MTYLTDEKLAEHMTGDCGRGPMNAAPYFMQVPIQHRNMVALKSNQIQNSSPGWNYSGAVYEAVQQYLTNPEAFVKRFEDGSLRTAEVQAWERRTGNIAPMSAFTGRPGDPILR